MQHQELLLHIQTVKQRERQMRIPHICLEISYTLKVNQDCLFFLYKQTNPDILLYLLMEVQRTQKKLLQQGKGQLRVIVIGFLYIERM